MSDVHAPPGRAKMTAAANAFAQRMMDKPIGDSLNSDPDARIFYDPPELIQIAFGGRQWFWDQGCGAVHRVGLFHGLGWELPLLVQRQDERGITGVRITARKTRRVQTGSEQLYDIEFLARPQLDPDNVSAPLPATRIVTHRPGITAANLKSVYADELGEHAI